jgi:glucose/arabinose dehydrogenase
MPVMHRSGVRRASALFVACLLLAAPLAASSEARSLGAEVTIGPSSGSASGVLAAPGDAHIKLTLLASGLSKPVYATSAHDGSRRIFIVEQTGKVKIYRDGHVRATPFLSLSRSVSHGSEQGLLGLAFHPKFTTNRKLYVNLTNTAGDTVIREYRVSRANRNVVNTATERRILRIGQPFANHNGGHLAFGPDGYLYIGMGDGGSGGDPNGNAQNINVLLGKMLRIGVNSTSPGLAYRIVGSNPYVGISGRDEIWQIGLRNPWRFSFDRGTYNLWIGDVGQGSWEEIDRAAQTGAGPGPGLNWGWNVMEGTHCYSPSSGCDMSGKALPLLEYDHSNGRCAVTGGYVYRGSAIPTLRGGYVFGDFCSGEIWVVDANASSPAAKVPLLDTNLLISSFGEIGDNELVVTDLNGRLYRIDPA